MKNKGKFKPIIISPYDWNVYVCYGEGDFKRLIKKYKLGKEWTSAFPGARGWCQLMEDTDGVSFVIMYIGECEGSSPIGTIIHECSHAIDYMFDVRGLPVDVTATELRAYHLEKLVEEVLLTSPF